MDTEIIYRVLLAALWGGLVGIEREYRSKSAGFRTMIMISMGSCFFTLMSEFIGHDNNPDRIASNILTGIGFIGAGVIFRGDNKINGITTAATIWTVAAVGMGIGAGYYIASASASILILIVLAILPLVERKVDAWHQSKTYTIKTTFTAEAIPDIEQHFITHNLKYKITGQIKEKTEITSTWQVHGHEKDHHAFIKLMQSQDTIYRFEY
ncbi:MAG: MgtC/SapB family protein [Bacteroidetes bacterium]|nr:MgtC/SapB family protein [Bacteroidota bacterium]